jgi:hypothetical protein
MGTSFNPRAPFIRIRDSLLPGMIGKLVHIDGSKHPGVVFRLLSLTDTHMNVETPKTHKPYTFARWRAQYTRGDEPAPEGLTPTKAMGDPEDPLVKAIKERCASRPSYSWPADAQRAARHLTDQPGNTYGHLAAFHCQYCHFWHIGRP